jgi:N-formylmaleamate deformylase
MDSWTESRVAANGVTLQIYRTGGGRQPLILVHGITDNGLCWTPVAGRLSSRCDVIMYDARGHGRSDAPGSGYALADYADDLIGLVYALGLQQPLVLGHSLGAATAALAAATQPDLFRAIALEDPPWNANQAPPTPESSAWLEEWRSRVVANKQKSRGELLAQGRAQSPRWSDEELSPWADAKRQVDPVVFDGAGSVGTGWRELVPRITCPALLIIGDNSAGAIVGPPVVDELSRLHPPLQVAHIEGAGHNIRRDSFEAYMQTVERFFQEA